MSTLLEPNDTFPSLTLQITDGNTLALPDQLTGEYGILLIFRGHW